MEPAALRIIYNYTTQSKSTYTLKTAVLRVYVDFD